MVARPEVGSARPSSSRMVVDFPAPFGPRNPVMRPGASSKVRSLTAVTVPYRLVSASTAMVLMAVPPEVVVNVVRCTRLTLGGAAARGVGRQDALSRTAAAYRIRRGMYADGGSRSAAGGDQPGLVGGDAQPLLRGRPGPGRHPFPLQRPAATGPGFPPGLLSP